MEAIKINNTTLEFNKIIYVDAINGSDETGDGSKSNPYKTLGKATINYQENYCIKLGDGIYSYTSLIELVQNNITIIGEGLNTILELQKSNNETVSNKTARFYRMIIQPSSSFGGDNRYLFFSYTGSVFEIEFHNIFFKSINNFPTTSFFAWATNTNKGTGADVKVHNCTFNNKTIDVTGYKPKQLYINCVLSSPIREGTNINSFELLVDSKTGTPFGDWQNIGIGLNPDGTQAHIGVYGGEFAWGNWKKILLKSNNKYYTYQNNEFIEVEPTVENFKENSVDLSQLTTPTNKVVLTMEEGEDLGDGKIFRKTINVDKYKDIENIYI